MLLAQLLISNDLARAPSGIPPLNGLRYRGRVRIRITNDRIVHRSTSVNYPGSRSFSVSQILSHAQILARICRHTYDHVAPLLLVFLLVDHKRDEDNGEQNGAD